MRVHLVAGLAGVIGCLLAGTMSAGAQEYPWCARYGGSMGGASNCGFVSYQQCMATLSGSSGFCEQNAFYQAPAVTQPADPAGERPRKRRQPQ
jgi:hypothetical protein